jgi:hypothetical protein
VTEPTSGWLATGVSWRSGRPVVSGRRPSGAHHSEPAGQSDELSWRIGGPRRCVGVWLPAIGEARPCPSHNTVEPTSTIAQCGGCAGGDPGALVARNLADDPRPFAVYLAWFGDGLLKVGLTATERGTDRLIEQGALAFGWLARGSFSAARRVELAVAGTGVAAERVPRRAKLATWWHPPGRGVAARQLESAHEQISRALTWPAGITPVDFEVTDLAAADGLGDGLHADEEITALAADAVLRGRISFVAGHDALITADDHVRLIDLRLLCGWTLAPAPPALPAGGGLHTAPIVREKPDPGQQGTLF